MHTLENESLRISVADHGAELCAIYDKVHGRDVLWNADPAHWNRHAPILFPFVGRLNGNVYRYKGQTYPMGQHGFARDMDFALLEEGDDAVVHRLAATPETLEKYPFDFALTVRHRLQGNTLLVGWQVENRGGDTMYFSIGGHPAFLCPVLPGTSQTDYKLAFYGCRALRYKTVDAATGTLHNDVTHTLTLAADGSLPLTAHTFDNDALVFDDAQVAAVGLTYPDGRPYITLRCPDFPSLGVWSKPGCAAPFVCLEPWIGRCDNYGFAGELPEKYGVTALAPKGQFAAEYTITVD